MCEAVRLRKIRQRKSWVELQFKKEVLAEVGVAYVQQLGIPKCSSGGASSQGSQPSIPTSSMRMGGGTHTYMYSRVCIVFEQAVMSMWVS